MKIDIFRKVVQTIMYTVDSYEWQNTNKLLDGDLEFQGTIGCKTGVTPVAGPCFAGAFERNILEVPGMKT